MDSRHLIACIVVTLGLAPLALRFGLRRIARERNASLLGCYLIVIICLVPMSLGLAGTCFAGGTLFGLWLLPGALLVLAVVWKHYRLSLGSAMRAWLPTAPLWLLAEVLWLAICVPAYRAERAVLMGFVCRDQASELGRAMGVYRANNSGQLPPTLDALRAADPTISERLLRCPVTGRPYVYVPVTWTSVPNTIVLCDTTGSHEWRTVLYHNGTAEQVHEKSFQAELALPQHAQLAAKLREMESPP